MDGLSGFNILQGGLYSIKPCFSSVHDFKNLVRTQFTSLPADVDAVAARLREFVGDLRSVAAARGSATVQVWAAASLLVEDVENIIFGVQSAGASDIDITLKQDLARYTEALRELDVRLPVQPEFFIVDRFPHPVSHAIWTAATFYREDEKQFGTRPGVYLRRDRLAPRVASAALAHELIHVILDRDGKAIPRRFEEGICELVGSCYLAGRSMGFELATTVMRNTLLNNPSEPLWWLYASNLAQANQVYAKFGLEGVAEIMRREQERDYVVQVERLVLEGKAQSLDLPTGQFVSAVTESVNAICAMPIHFVLSPLAYLVAKRMRGVGTAWQLTSDYPVTRAEVEGAIEELAAYPLALVNESGELVYEIASIYFDCSALRYRLPVPGLRAAIRVDQSLDGARKRSGPGKGA